MFSDKDIHASGPRGPYSSFVHRVGRFTQKHQLNQQRVQDDIRRIGSVAPADLRVLQQDGKRKLEKIDSLTLQLRGLQAEASTLEQAQAKPVRRCPVGSGNSTRARLSKGLKLPQMRQQTPVLV